MQAEGLFFRVETSEVLYFRPKVTGVLLTCNKVNATTPHPKGKSNCIKTLRRGEHFSSDRSAAGSGVSMIQVTMVHKLKLSVCLYLIGLVEKS